MAVRKTLLNNKHTATTNNNTPPSEKIRLDLWLWAARFFKTRALANEAITGGKVHLNDQRVKPSHLVKATDELIITRGQDTFTVIVQGINQKRRPAKEAVLLYQETDESQIQREQAAEQRRLHATGLHNEKRPDKHQRRLGRLLKRF
ncbi:MAG TPA: RNA-binding protein [Thiothrix sp.]|nr:RNA-binding protein [Thiothrix sp.]